MQQQQQQHQDLGRGGSTPPQQCCSTSPSLRGVNPPWSPSRTCHCNTLKVADHAVCRSPSKARSLTRGSFRSQSEMPQQWPGHDQVHLARPWPAKAMMAKPWQSKSPGMAHPSVLAWNSVRVRNVRNMFGPRLFETFCQNQSKSHPNQAKSTQITKSHNVEIWGCQF